MEGRSTSGRGYIERVGERNETEAGRSYRHWIELIQELRVALTDRQLLDEILEAQ